MTSYTPPAPDQVWSAPGDTPRRALRWAALGEEVRAAVILVGALLVVGVGLGLVWAWWSPQGPQGFVLPAGTIQVSEKSEAFAAADGRFAVLTVGVGVIAGTAMWFLRSVRGPAVALALGGGGWLAALVTSQVGHWVAGGTNRGPVHSFIAHLPLTVHLSGLVMLEGAVAVLLYSVLAAFAVHDDLGRPDPARDAIRSVAPEAGLEQPAGQHAGLDGDAAGLAQQDGFAPQQTGDAS